MKTSCWRSQRMLWRRKLYKRRKRSREEKKEKESFLARSSSSLTTVLSTTSTPSYLPTDQDILQSQVKTNGITETTFKVGELTYKPLDVGSQRRRGFGNVTAWVFLVSLSECDQMLHEGEMWYLLQNLHPLYCKADALQSYLVVFTLPYLDTQFPIY